MTATDRTPRERVVDAAAELVAQRGVAGVGMREVVAHAGAPRGSLQHYFPGGKAQLVAEALVQADRVGGGPLRRGAAEGDTPAELLARWCGWWRRRLERTDFRTGCPLVAAVADDAGVEDARTALDAWQAEAAGVLERTGHDPERATSLASVLVSAVEGAVVLARAQHCTAPLDAVERELAPLLDRRPPR
ncbi:TetR/AcrR family transcriptional regulator [Rhodococcus aerolatus]